MLKRHVNSNIPETKRSNNLPTSMLHLFMRCVCCDCVYPVTFSEQRNIQHRKNATSSANNAHANKSCTPPDLLDLWAMSEDSLAELRPESMPVCPVADPSNWQIYKVPTTSDWSNSPTGIIDLRPPAHHNEGRQLNTAVGRLLMLISTPYVDSSARPQTRK